MLVFQSLQPLQSTWLVACCKVGKTHGACLLLVTVIPPCNPKPHLHLHMLLLHFGIGLLSHGTGHAMVILC